MDITSLSLAELKTRLESQVDQGKLALAPDLLGDPTLAGFLAGLPGGRAVLTGPRFDLADTAWPQRLTVTGQVGTAWPVSAFAADAFQVGPFVLTVTRAAAGRPAQVGVTVDATLRVGALALPVTGSLTPDGALASTLRAGDHPPQDLADLLTLVSGSAGTTGLPSGTPFATGLTINDLALRTRLGEAPLTSLVLTLDSAVDWPVVANRFVLRSIGVTLVATHTAVPNSFSQVGFGASLHATLLIGREFTVSLGFGSGGPWELDIVPADGVLPSLADLAGLIGGQSLQDSVRTGLAAVGLGEIGIDGVQIGFDPHAGALRHIAVAGHLVLAGVRFDLTARLPGFQFGGHLGDGETIGLKRLFEHFFGTAEGFPDVVVTELGLTAYPQEGSYELELTVEDDEFVLGPVAFQQLSATIAKDASGYTGSIRAGLTLGGAQLLIEASRPDSGGVWVFTGTTGPGQQLRVSDLHADLGTTFDAFTLPAAVRDLLIDELLIRFDTRGNFTFTCHTRFPVSDTGNLDLTLVIDVAARDGGPSEIRSRATAVIGDLHFEVDFARTEGALSLLAAYTAQPKRTAQKIATLLAPVLDACPALAPLIPDSLEIELKDAFVFLDQARPATGGSPARPGRVLFGLDLGASLDLAQLPLVGRELPDGQRAGVDDLQIIVAATAFTAADVAAVNALLPAGITRLPGTAGDGSALPAGITLGAKLTLGGDPYPLALPVSPAPGGNPPAAPPAPVGGQPVVTAGNTQWLTLQRTFGPLHLNRVGFQYERQKLWFLLDASISLGGLTFTLDGLAVGSPLNDFAPEFDLHGLGLDYRNGPLAVSAGLLRVPLTGADGQPYDEYEGSALLTIRELTVSALGAYAYVGGYPSLFVYAFLDYPIGGPAFFQVTGIAAGFGYNRRLRVPAIDQIAQFPLVSKVMSDSSGPAPATDPITELSTLRPYLTPSEGDQFLAVGIRFTSFKQIDSFALLTLMFGQRFEIDILGLSTMKVPAAPDVPPIAEIQMAVKASFVPDEGFLGVAAQLTSASYLFSRDCHLSGGFAFYSWFSGTHGGDFVVTVGGYRPGFVPPAHYPVVPRLGFNWQIDSAVSVKGDAYFALTPSVLMAGGHLAATWNSGNLSAWFTAGVDFLIGWQPYHYEASLYVGIGVRYTYHFFGTHTLSVDVGADLSIWGPEFSGRARVHLSVISFEVSFGAGANQRPAPIDWPAFQAAFLPADSAEQPICTLAVRDGLVRAGDGDVDWVLSPRKFTLVTDSVVPAKTYDVGAGRIDGAVPAATFGIAPMDVPATQFGSTHAVTITRDGSTDVTNLFAFEPVSKRVPRALWGESVTTRADPDPLIADSLAGFAITPIAPVLPAVDPPQSIPDSQAGYSMEQIDQAFDLVDEKVFRPATEQGRDAVDRALGSTKRDTLLADLGVDEQITVGGRTAAAFLVVPLVGKLIGQ
ncbi:DUF6603 domain-containing protein [Micromonospora sp. NPDC001898]|uniref:DUF6603 domain-containing protein n=1 Tax=Micromonospora sp. NPDC001898 TaxID=3364221 RepID=UPI0036ADCAD6